jgi:large subunit ribosomal protein L18
MKNLQKIKQQKRVRRHKRIRAKIKGTAKRPRLSVFRSNKYIYAQLIDDSKGHTLISVSDLELEKLKIKNKKLKTQIKNEKTEKILSSKIKVTYEIGRLIAQKALEKKIKQVVFDKGEYKYHGRIKAVAEGAREAGLVF